MSGDVHELQIYTIISRIEDLIEESPKPKFGGPTKRVVDLEEVLDLLGDLKVTIPEDIRRANSVMVEAQNLKENADDYAHEKMETARQEAQAMTDNAEYQSKNTMDAAEEQAKQTVDTANRKARLLVEEATGKANDIMEKAKNEYERLVSEEVVYREAQRRAQLLAKKAEHSATMVYENAKVYADNILADLEGFVGEYKQLISANRKDLGARTVAETAAPKKPEPVAVQEDDETEAEVNETYTENRRDPRFVVDEEVYDDDDYDDEEEDGTLFSIFKRKRKD